MKGILFALIVAFVSISMMGCNTVHGVGKDVESAGRAIQKSSQ